MQRLRHPIRSITEPYGKAGLTVAILALVLALTGAAFAAVGLSSKQKKEVTAIAKKYAGKPGATGANGANGSNGAPGEKGEKGDTGNTGAPGENVTVTESANAFAGGHCNNTTTGKGGSKFQVGSGTPAFACNGKNGAIQPEETLPSGATETGVWTTVTPASGTLAQQEEGTSSDAPVSFSIPVLPAPTFVYVPNDGTTGAYGSNAGGGCPGVTAESVPQAASGKFCVYGKGAVFFGTVLPSVTAVENAPVTPAGVVLEVTCPNGAVICNSNAGLWAVTAE